MGSSHDVEITVLRRFDPAEVFENSPVTPEQPIKKCNLFRESQEFIASGNDPKVPEAVCSAAWTSIFPYVLSLSSGGESSWLKEKNVAIAACVDGLSPVIFKLERI